MTENFSMEYIIPAIIAVICLVTAFAGIGFKLLYRKRSKRMNILVKGTVKRLIVSINKNCKSLKASINVKDKLNNDGVELVGYQLKVNTTNNCCNIEKNDFEKSEFDLTGLCSPEFLLMIYQNKCLCIFELEFSENNENNDKSVLEGNHNSNNHNKQKYSGTVISIRVGE